MTETIITGVIFGIVALVKMITEESFAGVTGKYNDRGTITKTSEPSYDKKAAKKLWEQSAELLKMNQDEMIL